MKTTAKTTLRVLKGDAMLLKAALISARRESPYSDSVAGLEARLRQNEYAQAAVSTFVDSGKSALKAAVANGFVLVQNEL